MEKVEFFPMEKSQASVCGYIHTPITEIDNCRMKFPAVVVCPGGAYRRVAAGEADPVALRYFAAGYNVFILNYSVCDKAKNFQPLSELSAVLCKLRENSEIWYTDSDHIAVCGFSAGGHLAASLGTLWNHEKLKAVFDTKNGKNKPNAMILGYPVITADKRYAHIESIENVSGKKISDSDAEFFSLENRVSKETVPAFIFHTADDASVKAENSLRFAAALQETGILYELHILPSGKHGLSVCTEETGLRDDYNARWMEMSIMWLNRQFGYHI